MIVHHLSNSHSHVILWLLEELGTPYEIVQHERDPRTGRSPASLAAVHPLAKAPTIVDQGLAMIESTGIILYILEKYGEGRLRPAPGSVDAMRFLQHLTFIEGTAKSPLMGLMRLQSQPADDPARLAAEEQGFSRIAVLDRAVAEGGGTLVAGQFTAADMQLAFFEELVDAMLSLDRWPHLAAHLVRCREMESYHRAETKGGQLGMKPLFARIARAVSAARAQQPGG